MLYGVTLGTISLFIVFLIIVFISRKISDYEEREKQEKRPGQYADSAVQQVEAETEQKSGAAASDTAAGNIKNAIMQGPITKEWYKSIGSETENTETESDIRGTDTSAGIGNSAAFLEDTGVYCEEAKPEEAVQKVKHYLPKPAKSKYKRPVAKKSTAAGNREERRQKDISISNSPQKTNIYYVLVEFEEGGKEYTYKCDLPDIDVGDFVRVKARGKKKTVRVTDTDTQCDFDVKSKILRRATAAEEWEWKYGKDEDFFDEDLEETVEPEPEPEEDYDSSYYTSCDEEEQEQSELNERRLPSPEEFLANPRLIIEWEINWPRNPEDWWKATTDPRYWMLEYNEWSNEKAAERKREEEEK